MPPNSRTYSHVRALAESALPIIETQKSQSVGLVVHPSIGNMSWVSASIFELYVEHTP